jgi:hypothetical protein
MGFIAGIPAIIVLVWVSSRGLSAAFLDVYLPVLFLLPDYYRWVLPALPDPTFGEAAVLPLAVLFVMKSGGKWRFSVTDFLICGFALSMAVSEYLNAGYSDAQNLTFDMLGTVVCPYMLAKGIIEPNGLRVAFARKVVILLFWISVVSVYEFRFGQTPWQLALWRFFPGQGAGWVTTFRWGFARVAGPYGHAILAGLILVVGFRLQRWLDWTGKWELKSRHFPSLPIRKSLAITLGLLAGVLMTMVRGPWVGGVLGAVLTSVGRAKNRKLAMMALVAGLLLVVVPASVALYSWASVGRANAKSTSQETAAYRKELIDKYVVIVEEKLAWGWGTNGWPKVDGMGSIDNYYLLLSLMHGVIATLFLLGILLSMTVRLMARGMARPPTALRGGSLAFTLAGIHLAILVTIASVFMGGQVVALWALMTGWSEGYLLADKENETESGEPRVVTAALPFQFPRVVV